MMDHGSGEKSPAGGGGIAARCRSALPACLAGALLAGASALATSSAWCADYHEAPMLEELVKAGKLPAVAERLPAHPRVITPVEKVGEYGGTWRSGMVGGSDRNWLFRIAGYEPLLAWDRDWTGKVDAEPGRGVFQQRRCHRVHLQAAQGPEMVGRPALHIGRYRLLRQRASRPTRTCFPNATGLADGRRQGRASSRRSTTTPSRSHSRRPTACSRSGWPAVYGVQIDMMAKHYCSQFMPAYNKDKLDGLIKQAGVKNWTELFIKKCAVDTEANERWQNPDRPVMEPWVIKEPYVGGATIVTLERNPYYHKVDTAGNQLPYIDKLQVSVNADAQTLVLKAVNGEIDYQDRHINKNSNRAVFLDSAKMATIGWSTRRTRT